LAKTTLKWGDEEFWDSSPRFLFEQFELFSKYNKPKKDNRTRKSRRNDRGETIRTEVKRYKVLDSIGVK